MKKIIKMFVGVLVALTNLVYGYGDYRRFYVLETIARIPYFSYLAVLHVYQTLGKKPSLALMDLHYKESVNEQYHLMIMKELGGGDRWYDRWLVRFAGLNYYWITILLYLISPKSAYYIMELIETEAVSSYQTLLKVAEEKLKKTPATPTSLVYYYSEQARMTKPSILTLTHLSMYQVIESIRDDEMVHIKDMNTCSALNNTSGFNS